MFRGGTTTKGPRGGGGVQLNRRHYQGGKNKPYKISPATVLLVFALLIVVLLGTMKLSIFSSNTSHTNIVLPSCQEPFAIWSHRGYVNKYDHDHSTSNAETCQDALTELQKSGIRHLDMNVIFTKDDLTLVAHPSESETFSPCARIPLQTFLQVCAHVFGPNEYFVTFEPKARWNSTVVGDADWAPPEHVVGGILNTLEMKKSKPLIPKQHCGLILTEQQWQSSQLLAMQERILNVCQQLVLPLSKSNGVIDLDMYPTKSIPNSYRLTMPGLEYFNGPPRPSRFLENLITDTKFAKSNQKQWSKTTNIVWIIDTLNDLRKVLQLQNVHGIVSNQPLKMIQFYQELCQKTYHVPNQLVL